MRITQGCCMYTMVLSSAYPPHGNLLSCSMSVAGIDSGKGIVLKRLFALLIDSSEVDSTRLSEKLKRNRKEPGLSDSIQHKERNGRARCAGGMEMWWKRRERKQRVKSSNCAIQGVGMELKLSVWVDWTCDLSLDVFCLLVLS